MKRKAFVQLTGIASYFAKTALIMLLILSMFAGCSAYPEEYPFENKDEPIESIELIYHPYVKTLEGEDVLISVRFLNSNEIPVFMESVYSLQTKTARPTPPSGWGIYIARVTYENGDVEYLGSGHIEFVENGSEPFSIGRYYFPGDSFDKLFLQYAGNLSHLDTN